MKRTLSSIVKSKVFLVVAIVILIAVVAICALRYTNSEFRYNFDIVFNCDDTHYSYITDDEGAEVEKLSLPLPPSTAVAHRHSDVAVTYYSKLQCVDFLEYYKTEGYTVEGNTVFTDSGAFILNETEADTENTWKYYFVDIELSE